MDLKTINISHTSVFYLKEDLDYCGILLNKFRIFTF